MKHIINGIFLVTLSFFLHWLLLHFNWYSELPSINIAPVFNIPGNTSMADQSTANQNSTNNSVKIPIDNFTANDSSVSASQSQESASTEDAPVKMDFNSIIIKKV